MYLNSLLDWPHELSCTSFLLYSPALCSGTQDWVVFIGGGVTLDA